MITISNLAMQFGGSVLFKQVDLQFTPGNCYGVIGANGAGKSTFLKILSGELEPTSGSISFKPGARLSVLKQDQNQYDAYSILDTVIMGNQHLYDIMKEKDALYEKEDFSDEDGVFFGKVQGVRSLISYEGETREALQADFRKAVDAYLELCQEKS